jgi:lipopolysaccharide transport system permease protein
MDNLKTNWHQVKILTYANMKARYRKTIVGFFWVVLNPILMYSVQAIVFTKFLKLDLPNYYVFLLGGLLPWIFINSSWDSCITSIVTASPILKSFQISPLVILSSAILESFVNFIAAFLILLIPTLLLSETYSLNLLLLPISLLLLIMFTIVSTSLLATLHVFYRDVKYVTQFAMSILYFLTPIFYPTSFIPENYQWIIDVNPLYILIEPFRACIYNGSTSEIVMMQLKGLALVLVLLLIFNKFWSKKKNALFLKL